MSFVDDLDLRSYRQPYVLANTPLFLYKRFREIAETRQLAAQHTAEDLVTAFNEHANRVGAPCEDDELRAYVALIALSFRERSEVVRSIERIRPQRLRWARQLLDVISEPQVATTIKTVHARPPQPRVIGESNSSPPATSLILLVNR